MPAAGGVKGHRKAGGRRGISEWVRNILATLSMSQLALTGPRIE